MKHNAVSNQTITFVTFYFQTSPITGTN